MKTIKVSEATGAVLNWLVAKCEGRNLQRFPMGAQGGHGWWVWEDKDTGHDGMTYLPIGPRTKPKTRNSGEVFSPSTDWAQGGPIIPRERIGLDQFPNSPCRAYIGTPVKYEHAMWAPEGDPLLAAMRCYVASKLGDTVEVPDELV
jgi:hypothetical protein